MGGRKIDDHSFFAGKAGKASPLPDGNAVKSMEPGMGCGYLNDYQDSQEAIKKTQDRNARVANDQKQNPMYRY